MTLLSSSESVRKETHAMSTGPDVVFDGYVFLFRSFGLEIKHSINTAVPTYCRYQETSLQMLLA